MEHDCITYHIDQNDHIIYISDEWQPFADRNKAEELTKGCVLNRSIYDFISDKESRHIYELTFSRCRKNNSHIHLPFRCDAPHTRRFMRMDISALEDNAIRITSCIEREEARDPVALLDKEQDRSSEFVTICSWCKKVRLEEQHWVEVEEAVTQMKLFEAISLPQLSHGMCESCHHDQMQALKRDM